MPAGVKEVVYDSKIEFFRSKDGELLFGLTFGLLRGTLTFRQQIRRLRLVVRRLYSESLRSGIGFLSGTVCVLLRNLIGGLLRLMLISELNRGENIFRN